MERVVFDVSRPWGPYEPPRSMLAQGDGPLWRDTLNAHVRDGDLRFREVLQGQDKASAADPTATLTPLHSSVDTAWNQQAAKLILDIDDATYASRLLVTTREILLYWANTDTWINLTPTYNTGDVSITNGTAALTFAGGANVQDRGFGTGTFIELPAGSGDWYPISTITSNTAGTLVSNYQGTTLTNSAYTIRRTFHPYKGENIYNVAATHYFAQVFAGDLFIGGAFGMNDGASTVDGIDGIVYRLPDIVRTSAPAASDMTYIFGGEKDYTGSLDELTYRAIIYGMQVVEDGRVVLAIRAPASSGAYNSRIVWSTNSYPPTTWTQAPGGATDLVSRQGPITGLGRVGFDLTAHFTDGILLGYLTGDTNEPLAWRRTKAEFGTASPMALVNMHGSEVYPSTDFNIRVFEGLTSPVFDSGARRFFEDNGVVRSNLEVAHAYHYEEREEYRIFIVSPHSTTVPVSEGLTYAYYTRGGTGWKQKFALPLTAVVERPKFAEDGKNASIPGNHAFTRVDRKVGVVATLAYDEGPDAWNTSFLVMLDEDAEVDDDNVGTASAAGGFMVTSDNVDLGLPGIEKHVARILLVYSSTGDGIDHNVDISLSYDNGATWEDVTVSPDWQTGDDDQKVVIAEFSEGAAEKFKIKISTSEKMAYLLGPMIAEVAILGEVQAA